jgi:hypothetical protein
MPGVLVLAYALPPLALPVGAWAWRHFFSRAKHAGIAVSPLLRPGLSSTVASE